MRAAERVVLHHDTRNQIRPFTGQAFSMAGIPSEPAERNALQFRDGKPAQLPDEPLMYLCDCGDECDCWHREAGPLTPMEVDDDATLSAVIAAEHD